MPVATEPTTGVLVEAVRSAEGCVGYLVVDASSRDALAIDPRLDLVGRFQDLLRARNAKLVHVLDTHTHADHLSGVRRLAGATGAQVLAHAASKLRTPARRLEGGPTFELGRSTVRVIHASGHTPDSLALHVAGHLFSGNALFVGGAGRTDFMGGSPSELYDTFRRFESLPDDTVVHPGHDYTGHLTTTVGDEKAKNPLLGERDRSALAAKLASTSPPPANMTEILRHNLAESDSLTVSAAEVAAIRSSSSATVLVDVRSPLEFESEHIVGSSTCRSGSWTLASERSRSRASSSSSAGPGSARSVPRRRSRGRVASPACSKEASPAGGRRAFRSARGASASRSIVRSSSSSGWPSSRARSSAPS